MWRAFGHVVAFKLVAYVRCCQFDVVEWGLKYFKLNFETAIPNNTFLSHKSLTRRYVQGSHYKYRESKQYISAEGISWDRNIVLIFYIYDDYQERIKERDSTEP